MIRLLLTLAARWLAFACSLLSDALAACSRGGLRGALSEVKAQAHGLHALALAAPLIYSETRRVTTEADNLRAAWEGGEDVDAYARRRCEAAGVPVGSEVYYSLLAWAGTMAKAWASEMPDDGERVSELAALAEPDAEAWPDTIPG